MSSQLILTAFAWVKANPVATVQWLVLAWGVANVVWAQWPKPKSERAQKVWAAIHHILQLITTTSSASGTFTWPSIIRAVTGNLLKSPDAFATDPAHVPDPSAPPVKAKNADQIADEVIARMEKKPPPEIQ